MAIAFPNAEISFASASTFAPDCHHYVRTIKVNAPRSECTARIGGA